MTFAYLASLDMLRAAELGFTTVQVQTSGQPSYTVTLGSVTGPTGDMASTCTVFNHAAFGLALTRGEDRSASTAMMAGYSGFSIAGAVTDALNTAQATAGSTATATVTFDMTTLQYTFAFNVASSLTFGSDQTAWLFGFDGDRTAATSHVSNITPWGVIRPVLSDVSEPTTNYEAEGIASQAVSAGNAVVGLARSSVPIYRDWIQQYETKAKTLRLSADASHPFTHQELFEVSRASLPFVVTDAFGDTLQEVFYFRADSSSWKCDRATTANDTQFHIHYRTVVAGYIFFSFGG
jgi:hypothetical protein